MRAGWESGLAGAKGADLVAVPLPPGPAWPGILGSAWASGAAVLPVDHRLTGAEMERLLTAARPTALFDGERLERRADGVPVEPTVALVVATSGGEAKLAELGHDAVRAAVDASARRLGSAPGEPWLACLPIAHIGGLLVLARALLGGSPVEVHAGFELAAVARADAAYVSLVPAMLARLLDVGIDLARFRAILVGGAALPPALAGRARSAGARIVATYGATETCGGVVYDGVPLDGVALRVSAAGEIEIGGPTVMRAYRLRDPREGFAPDGLVRTGDRGTLEGGVLSVLGRLDDAITTGGETVWPAEVEAVLGEHPLVGEAAVTGRPDEVYGARIVAWVVAAADAAAPPAPEEVRAFASARLAPYKVPREVIVVEALPRTPSGKVARRALA